MLSALSHTAHHPRALWVRWVALLVLMVAAPATKHIVESMALFVHGVCGEAGDCDRCEDEGESDSEPRSCLHCSECTPASTLPSAAAPIASAALAFEIEPAAPIDMVAAGYRSQPFRPPAA